MNKCENMLNVFEEKIQFKYDEDNEECNIQFPLISIQDLTNFEEHVVPLSATTYYFKGNVRLRS